MASTDRNRIALRLTCAADAAAFARIRALVASLLAGDRSGAFGPEDEEEILLGLQEWLGNVARHGYGGEGRGRIRFSAWLARGRFRARIHDRGRPFHPPGEQLGTHAAGAADPVLPLDHGHGLRLLHRTMDRVCFARRGRDNVVLVERRGRGAADAGAASVKSCGRQAR